MSVDTLKMNYKLTIQAPVADDTNEFDFFAETYLGRLTVIVDYFLKLAPERKMPLVHSKDT